MPRLLDIAEDVQVLAQLISEAADEHGELSPEISTILDGWFGLIGDQQAQKVDSYCALIRENELEAVALQAELDRLERRKSARINLAQRLKNRLRQYMQLTGQKRIECQRYTASVCGAGGKLPVIITDDRLIPSEYIVQHPAPDKGKIGDALMDGKEVPGARLGERGNYLRIS